MSNFNLYTLQNSIYEIYYDTPKYINKIIICQSIIRKYICNKNNIYYCLKSPQITENFINEITGFHLIHNNPITESTWEYINTNIIKSTYKLTYYANGQHLSGKDLTFNNWNISNKTCKCKNNNISVSSYRLTKVCDIKNYGISQNIINEINNRNKSFEYYSILLRKELNNTITYYWCIVPEDYYIFNINKYNLIYKYNKQNKVIGWQSKYYTIIFSMSSQLWFNFKFNDIKKYIVQSIDININNKLLTYADINKLINL